MASKKITAADVHAAVAAQPLVGLKGAAGILGVKPPNVSRLRTQGRMSAAVPVEGSADVYVRSEVEALAGELGAERSARAGAAT